MKKQLEVQRQYIELRKQGLTYRQIGKQLGVTRNVVAGHLCRARSVYGDW
jgi:DNA-binding CsgD family transcriptional regulator